MAGDQRHGGNRRVPGRLSWRCGAKIRKYLIDNNYIDTVIQLPANLFFRGRHRYLHHRTEKEQKDNATLYRCLGRVYPRGQQEQTLRREYRAGFSMRSSPAKDDAHFARLVENGKIAENDYNISVSSYVEQPDTREEVDNDELNKRIAEIVARQNVLHGNRCNCSHFVRKGLSMNNKEITIRSSAAEYLIFVAATGENRFRVELRYEDENIWLTQRMMAELYGVDVRTINEHIRKIYADNELSEAATVRNFRIVQTEGSREVSREVKHYSLQMIISTGFKVNNERAVQFRKWANAVVKDYTIQGWVMDDERLKRGGTVLTKDYFEKQLERIREIRLSERRFYQKITDIYATAVDYDPTAKATQRFFAAVQNKMHYSVHGHTAAELIYQRADADKEHMGLTTWEGAPTGKIHKYDVTVAKNYLTEEELQTLGRIVSAYLDLAEIQAMRHIPMTMEDWEKRLNGFFVADGSGGACQCRPHLSGAGQSPCRKRMGEISHRSGSSLYERFRPLRATGGTCSRQGERR